MRNTLILLVLSIIPLSLFQMSCEKKTVRSQGTDWDAVKAIISENPEVFDLGFFDTDQDTLFYREITQSNADIEAGTLLVADTLHFFDYIILTWGDSLKGKFHYRVNGKPYEKPISSIALTKAYFEKHGPSYTLHRGWRLRRFGGTVINSVGTTRGISSLTIISDGIDVDLGESALKKLVHKDSTLVFGKGKEVMFIIKPLTDTYDFFFLHVKEGDAYQKIPFTNNGDETLSATWTTTTDPEKAEGYKHAIVDVVNRESVTDTLAKYDSKAWGIIYRIE
ncbi:MAG: hypothetical protein AMJ73_09650 [candidate division Zixibacteria bacterium SM1_73]|nr:MAG: hypothetical protein AMJ73_09650 [candidate division Zixibacteria bacterium SM1_73]